MKPKATFLTQYYPPEMGAPPARISEFAQGLAGCGWDIHIITALPNYPEGKVFPNYRGKWSVNEQINGIPVTRTWIRPDGTGRILHRLIGALTFAASSTSNILFSRRHTDVIITESPPLPLAFAGAMAAELLSIPHVLNISDLWPGALVEMGALRNPFLIKSAEIVEAISYRLSACITGQSQEIIDDIKTRFPGKPTQLISNGVDTNVFSPSLYSRELRSSMVDSESETILVTYAGLHGLPQGLHSIVEAANRLRDSKNIQFLFIGDGPTKADLIRQARTLQLQNIRFLPPQPRTEVARILASSDMAVIPLTQPLKGCIPSKIYEAMASGIPIVAAVGGKVAEIIDETGAGLNALPSNAESIADTIEKFASNPELRTSHARSGRKAALTIYDRKIWVNRLDQCLRNTL